MKKFLPIMLVRMQKNLEWRMTLKENKWQGLIPGDIVEYKGKKLMYRGINKNGGPGMPGLPEPIFGSASPKEPGCVYYLRPKGTVFTKTVFDENAEPVQAGSSGISIGFLNTNGLDFKKVGYITPEQWKAMAAA